MPTPTELDVLNGNYVANDGATGLLIENRAVAARTVDILLPAGADVDLSAGPRSYTLQAGEVAFVGPYPVDPYTEQLLVNTSGFDVDVTAISYR